MWLEIGLLHIFKEGGNVYGTYVYKQRGAKTFKVQGHEQ